MDIFFFPFVKQLREETKQKRLKKVNELIIVTSKEVVNQNFVVRRNWNKGGHTHNGTVDFDKKM